MGLVCGPLPPMQGLAPQLRRGCCLGGASDPCVPAEAWSMIASPFLPKYLSSPRCAALQGALYLVGDNTKKVYVYDPGANLWQKVGLSLASQGDSRPQEP